MADTTTLPSEWVWRALAAVGSALLATATTIFATRKTAEAAMMEDVNDRFQLSFDRYDAEIERLERQMMEERQQCDHQLQHLRDEIARLMASPLNAPIAAYTDTDIARAEQTGRAAQIRHRRKEQLK